MALLGALVLAAAVAAAAPSVNDSPRVEPGGDTCKTVELPTKQVVFDEECQQALAALAFANALANAGTTAIGYLPNDPGSTYGTVLDVMVPLADDFLNNHTIPFQYRAFSYVLDDRAPHGTLDITTEWVNGPVQVKYNLTECITAVTLAGTTSEVCSDALDDQDSKLSLRFLDARINFTLVSLRPDGTNLSRLVHAANAGPIGTNTTWIFDATDPEGIYGFRGWLTDPSSNPGNTTRDLDLKGELVSAKVGFDVTPPKTTAILSPDPPSSGWFTGEVTVVLECKDAPLPDNAGCDPNSTTYTIDGGEVLNYTGAFPVSADGNHAVNFTSTDRAGNVEAIVSASVKIDTTPPRLTHIRTPANDAGWNKIPVTVDFDCIDEAPPAVPGATPSGVAFLSPDVTKSGEGAGQAALGFCTDVAGNRADLAVDNINIDLTRPVIVGTASPEPNPAGWNNAEVTVHFECSDALSGPDPLSITPDVVLGEAPSASAPGSCDDLAGNSASTSVGPVRVDLTNPSTAVLFGQETRNGWFNAPVDVTLTCDDGDGSQCNGTRFQLDGGAWTDYVGTFQVGTSDFHSLRFASIDFAGNLEAEGQRAILIDFVAPTVTGSQNPAANLGWNGGDVTVLFACADDLSGPDLDSVTADELLTAETDGNGVLVPGTCSDLAGNLGSTSFGPVRIDLSPPTTTVLLTGQLRGESGVYAGDVTVELACSDARSGCLDPGSIFYTVDDGAQQAYTGPFTLSGDGVHTLRFHSIDVVGNAETEQSIPVGIDATSPIITPLAPVPLSRGPARNVSIVASVSSAFPLDASTLRVTLDGADVEATLEAGRVVAPDLEVAPGEHTMSVSISTIHGNPASASWTFTVTEVRALRVTPALHHVTVGGADVAFTAVGLDAEGLEMALDPATDVAWSLASAAGGSFDANVLHPGSVAGTYTVQASLVAVPSIASTAALVLDPGDVTRLVVSPERVRVVIPGSAPFHAQAFDALGNVVPGVVATWSVEGGIGRVDANGLFTAVSAGSGQVVATLGSASANAAVTTIQRDDLAVRLALEPGSATVQAGHALPFAAQAFDADGGLLGGLRIRFSLDQPSVARLEPGHLVGLKAGTTRLVAQVGALEAASNITVVPGPAADLRVQPTAAALTGAGSVSFRADAFDAFHNALTTASVTWSVDDAAIGSIASDGTFTATGTGGLARVSARSGDLVREALVVVTSLAAPPNQVTEIVPAVSRGSVANVNTTSFVAAVASAEAAASLRIVPPAPTSSEPAAQENGTLLEASALVRSRVEAFALTVATQAGSLNVTPPEVDPGHLAQTIADAPQRGETGFFVTVNAAENGLAVNGTRLAEVVSHVDVGFSMNATFFEDRALAPQAARAIEYSEGRMVRADIPVVALTSAPVNGSWPFTVRLTQFSSFAIVWSPVQSVSALSAGGGGGGGGGRSGAFIPGVVEPFVSKTKDGTTAAGTVGGLRGESVAFKLDLADARLRNLTLGFKDGMVGAHLEVVVSALPQGAAALPEGLTPLLFLRAALDPPPTYLANASLSLTFGAADLAGHGLGDVRVLHFDGSSWSALPVEVEPHGEAGVVRAQLALPLRPLAVAFAPPPPPPEPLALHDLGPVLSARSPADGSLVADARPEIGARLGGLLSGAPSVEVHLDGARITAEADASGLRVRPEGPLADGPHAVTVLLTRADGRSTFSTWTFTVDTTAPVVGAQVPTGKAGPRDTLRASLRDAVSGVEPSSVELKLDGAKVAAKWTGDGVEFTPTSDLAPGRHVVELKAMDKAGNAAAASWAFTVEAASAAEPRATPGAPLVLVLAGLALAALALGRRKP